MATKFRMPIKRSPACDPQRYRVYRMEVEAVGARAYARMPRARVLKLVRSVCRNYGIPVPLVVWTDKLGRWAAEWSDVGETSRIAFSTKKGMSRDFLTVTHELAHHLHHWLDPVTCAAQEAHGPEFMACHMSILDVCRFIPVVGMRAICEKWKIRYADPGEKCSLADLQRAVGVTP